MAEGEPEVIEVIERSFSSVLPDAPVELLLADNSHAPPPSHGGRRSRRQATELRCRFTRSLPGGAPRTGFRNSVTAIISTPAPSCATARKAGCRLCASPSPSWVGPWASSMPPASPAAKVADDHVDDLAILAKLAGARIGLLRVMAETAAAGFDRHAHRAAEPALASRSASRPSRPISTRSPWRWPTWTTSRPLTTPMGTRRETGHCGSSTRVLRDTLRNSDIASRYGGEEFAIAFPDCSSIDATRALNTVRPSSTPQSRSAGSPSSP